MTHEVYRQRLAELLLRINDLEEQINADGCYECAFEDREEWEEPCCKCSRGCKDYWRRGAK